MLFIRSLIFYLGFSCATIFFGLMSVFLFPLPNRFSQRVILQWNRFINFWLRICCNLRYEVSGNIDSINGACVIVANHQSSWETFFLQSYFHPLSSVLKKELLAIPFFGWGLRLLDPIPIDRGNPVLALKQIKSLGKERLLDGRNVLIFPEGTRRPVGKLGEYKRSPADIAYAAKVPIVPIAHNAGRYWLNKKMVKYPGTIKICIGDPVMINDKNSSEMMKIIRDWTQVALIKMNLEKVS